MPIDALTLAALADELSATLPGARIQDIYQPTPEAVALQCYGQGQNRWLLASAHPQLARVHVVATKPKKLASEPPAFVMLLRKHLEGARVLALRQPRWERILEIGCARGPAPDGEPSHWLLVEVMGRLSNIILCDAAGIILGALHQVSLEVNHYRAITPHTPYRYPPPQTRKVDGEAQPRLRGETVSGEELAAAAAQTLADATEPQAEGQRKRSRRNALTVAALIAAQIEGFGRELGREVAARALGDPEAPLRADLAWETIAAEARLLAALPGAHDWHPTLVYANGETAPPTACAVYEPKQYGDARLRQMASVDEMLAVYYAGSEWRASVEGAKGDLRRLLQTLRERALRKDEALRGELAQQAEAQHLREEADTLLAFQADVPPHATSVTVANPFAESAEGQPATLTLTLDPRLSAVENANVRYNRYHKLQRAAALIPPQIEANQLELARIEQLATDLALAETPAEIAHVREEVAEAGYLRGRSAAAPQRGAKSGKASAKQKGKPGKGSKGAKGGQPQKRAQEGGAPLRRESSDGMLLLIGKNSRQNEEVTFHQASANDLWLHARGVPGAHVIVKSGGRPVSEATLREAAALAAYYSQSRAAGSVPVDYTEQRYVRHMKGGGPGMVIYERERTLQAMPADPAAE